MLFAQDASSTPIIVTVVGMVLATAGAAVTAIMSYMSARDKLRFDAKVIELQASVEHMRQREAECLKDVCDLQERLSRAESRLQEQEREQRDQKSQVDELRGKRK